MSEELSLGERRIRTKFNASNSTTVQSIKELAAQFINYLDNNIEYRDDDPAFNAEVGRLKAIAMTKIEEAALFAVKAVTTNLSW
jgi:hypothetical protein